MRGTVASQELLTYRNDLDISLSVRRKWSDGTAPLGKSFLWRASCTLGNHQWWTGWWLKLCKKYQSPFMSLSSTHPFYRLEILPNHQPVGFQHCFGIRGRCCTHMTPVVWTAWSHQNPKIGRSTFFVLGSFIDTLNMDYWLYWLYWLFVDGLLMV